RSPVDPCGPGKGGGGPLRCPHRARVLVVVAAVPFLSSASEGHRATADGDQLRPEQGQIPPTRPGWFAGPRQRRTHTVKETPKGVLITVTHTVEIQGEERPALVAEALGLWIP